MSKLCCNPIKMHKKKAIASLCFITKVFSIACPVPKENHANASGSAI